MEAFTCSLLSKVVPNTLRKRQQSSRGVHIVDVKKVCLQIWSNYWKKPVENFVSGLFSFCLVLLFLFLLLNCITYGIKLYLGLPQNLKWSSCRQKSTASSHQVCHTQRALRFCGKHRYAYAEGVNLISICPRQTDTSNYKINWQFLICFNFNVFSI